MFWKRWAVFALLLAMFCLQRHALQIFLIDYIFVDVNCCSLGDYKNGKYAWPLIFFKAVAGDSFTDLLLFSCVFEFRLS